MKIVEIELYRFKRFAATGIVRLRLTASALLQVILGTNGCGKSSLLRECTPMPAARSAYEEGKGYKRVVVHHDGREYVLTSDFSNRTSPHSFSRDGVELNEGGTEGVQTELIATHLGYTSEVHAIVTGTYKIAKMRPADRKALIMALNPCRIEFMHDDHKAVLSKLRALKINLAHLTERKAVLSGQFLEPELLSGLQAEAEEITHAVDKITEFLHTAAEQLRQLGPEVAVAEPSAAVVARCRAAARRLQRDAVALAAVPRADTEAYRAAAERLMSVAERDAERAAEALTQLAQEIERHQATLDELDALVSSAVLDAQIETMRAELTRLEATRADDPFPAALMDDLPEALAGLRDTLDHFLGCPVRLRPSAALARKRQLLDRRAYRLRMVEGELADAQRRLDAVRTRVRIRVEDVPDDPCARAQCPLYRDFRASVDAVRQEEQLLLARAARLGRYHGRLRAYVEGQTAQLSQLDAYTPHLVAVFQTLQQHSALRVVIQDLDILHTLAHNPLAIYERLRRHYERSLDHHRHQALTAELTAKVEERARLASAGQVERDFIQSSLDAKKTAHRALMADLERAEAARRTGAARLAALAAHRAAAELAQACDHELQAHLETVVQNHERATLRRLHTLLDSKRREAISRLGQIEHTLREQQLLRARFDEEIVSQIATLEGLQAEYQLLEEALSPLSGIPTEYTVAFVNAVLSAMNHFIRQIWTVPFELKPLNPDEPVDFRLAARSGGAVVPDLSECSDAQEEIVNLAFRCALMHRLGLHDYPIHLDEVGKAFDPQHKRMILDALRTLLDNNRVSQMWLINHHAEVHDGLANAEVLVLNDANVLAPMIYNEHVVLER